jgi:hypothetical protein
MSRSSLGLGRESPRLVAYDRYNMVSKADACRIRPCSAQTGEVGAGPGVRGALGWLSGVRRDGAAAPLPVLGPGGPALRVGLPSDFLVLRSRAEVRWLGQSRGLRVCWRFPSSCGRSVHRGIQFLKPYLTGATTAGFRDLAPLPAGLMITESCLRIARSIFRPEAKHRSATLITEDCRSRHRSLAR